MNTFNRLYTKLNEASSSTKAVLKELDTIGKSMDYQIKILKRWAQQLDEETQKMPGWVGAEVEVLDASSRTIWLKVLFLKDLYADDPMPIKDVVKHFERKGIMLKPSDDRHASENEFKTKVI